ncbi:unnamed protein product [Phytomonas sp. Hart1]|nr:unnamed protein product [Phytomonas sp. Hart1]|eukprot:CCW71174.1 unnamed protein product [Phytomonas sp. isolate Hart1]
MGICHSLTKVKRKKYDENFFISNGLTIGVETPSKTKLDFTNRLPHGSQKVTMHSVYDGDTVTVVLNDKSLQKVRLIGIDSPEMNLQEPFAVESTNFVKKCCPSGSEAWLVTSSLPKNLYDKYKRLLAFIYVPTTTGGPGYRLLNVTLILEGLAFFYAPNGADLLDKRNLLLSAQRLSIKKKSKLWSIAPLKRIVYLTRNGIAFHSKTCVYAKKISEKINVENAALRGLSPCRTCKPLT